MTYLKYDITLLEYTNTLINDLHKMVGDRNNKREYWDVLIQGKFLFRYLTLLSARIGSLTLVRMCEKLAGDGRLSLCDWCDTEHLLYEINRPAIYSIIRKPNKRLFRHLCTLPSSDIDLEIAEELVQVLLDSNDDRLVLSAELFLDAYELAYGLLMNGRSDFTANFVAKLEPSEYVDLTQVIFLKTSRNTQTRKTLNNLINQIKQVHFNGNKDDMMNTFGKELCPPIYDNEEATQLLKYLHMNMT